MTSNRLIDSPKKFKAGRSKDIVSAQVDETLRGIKTPTILFHLVKRHKFGLVLTWAVVITISYLFPPVWDIVGVAII